MDFPFLRSATFYNEKKRLFCTLPDEEFMQYRAKLVNRVKAGGIFFWVREVTTMCAVLYTPSDSSTTGNEPGRRHPS